MRLEYAHVDEADYRRGRAAVLRSFPPETNDHLYFTPLMRDEREAMAHANIAAEIRLLQATPWHLKSDTYPTSTPPP